MHVEMSARQEPRPAVGEQSRVGDVDDFQVTAGAKPDPCQRLEAVRRAADAGAALVAGPNRLAALSARRAKPAQRPYGSTHARFLWS